MCSITTRVIFSYFYNMKKMKRISIFFTLIVTPFLGFTTVKKKPFDSLKFELSKEQSDSDKIQTLIDLMEEHRTFDLVKAIDYGKQALQIATKSKNEKQLTKIYLTLGVCFYHAGDYDQAIEYYQLAKKVAEENNFQGKLASVYNNMAIIYGDLDQYDKCLEYFNNTVEVFKKSGNDLNLSSAYGNIGVVYTMQDENKKALQNFDKALEIAKKIDNQAGIGRFMSNAAQVYGNMGNYKKALSYYDESMMIAKELNHQILIGEILEGISWINLETKNYQEALETIFIGIENAKKSNARIQLKIGYGYAAEAYEGLGNIKKAYEYQKLYILYKDSILNEEQLSNINQIENKYKIQGIQNEVELLEKENLVLEQKKTIDTQHKYVLFGGLIAVAILALMMFFIQRGRLTKSKLRQQLLNEKLDYSDKEITNFALHIIQKNDLLDSMKIDLKQLKRAEDIGSQKVIIQELIMKLNNEIGLERDKKIFKEQLQEIGDRFMMQLEKKHPDLTSNEKRLTSLLRLNLSSKEIASILNISYKSVNMSRWRLRKKLGLDPEVELATFFNSF